MSFSESEKSFLFMISQIWRLCAIYPWTFVGKLRASSIHYYCPELKKNTALYTLVYLAVDRQRIGKSALWNTIKVAQLKSLEISEFQNGPLNLWVIVSSHFEVWRILRFPLTNRGFKLKANLHFYSARPSCWSSYGWIYEKCITQHQIRDVLLLGRFAKSAGTPVS